MGTLITWVPQATSIGDDAKQTLLCSSIWQPERNPVFSLLAQFCFSQPEKETLILTSAA